METRAFTADSRAPLSSCKTSCQLAYDALSLPKQAARVSLSECVCEEGGRQAHLRESRKKRRTRSWKPCLLFWGPWWWACMGPAALLGLQPSSHSCFSHHSAAEPPWQRLSQERMLFLKHFVSTFLRPGGCDVEKHKNKMTEGWRQAGRLLHGAAQRWKLMLFFCFSILFSCLPPQKKEKSWTCAEITLLLLAVVTPLCCSCSRGCFTRRAPPTSEDDS